MDLLGGCINTELLDNEFQNACCGLDDYLPCESDIKKEGASCLLDVFGQPMPPLGSFVSNHSCFTNTSDWNVNMDQVSLFGIMMNLLNGRGGCYK